MKKLLFIVLFTTVSLFSLFAQESNFVIPYTIRGGKMIVEMKINGVPTSLIFDTGGRTTITQKLMRELGLSVTDSLKVTDVNSKTVYYKMSNIESILTGENGVNFRGFPALIAPEPSPFECFGVEGLIGSELFSRMMIEIDNRAKTITILPSDVESKLSLRTMHPFVKSGSMPIIGMNIAGKIIPTLFDTGFGGFLSFKISDYKKSGLPSFSEAFAEGSLGMAGQAPTALSYRVKIDNLSVGGAKFKNVIAETSDPPFTLLGLKLLDYGKVSIDYLRGKFYFESYEKENDLTKVVNDFSLTVKDGKIVVSTVWTSMRGVIEAGDEITHINGKSVKENYNFCESITVGISEIKAKKRSVLTVKTRNGEKKITQIN